MRRVRVPASSGERACVHHGGRVCKGSTGAPVSAEAAVAVRAVDVEIAYGRTASSGERACVPRGDACARPARVHP